MCKCVCLYVTKRKVINLTKVCYVVFVEDDMMAIH